MSLVPLAEPDAARRLLAVRRALLAILVVGFGGTGAELLLLEHTDGFWQLVPVVLLAVSLAVIAWHARAGSRLSRRCWQATMAVVVASGLVGTFLHYEGNVEFEKELHPEADGLALFRGAMMGATPALAPGTMAALGLLGLVYAYTQPMLAARAGTAAPKEE